MNPFCLLPTCTQLKLELEAGDVWDKLTLAKLENKAVRAKAELFI